MQRLLLDAYVLALGAHVNRAALPALLGSALVPGLALAADGYLRYDCVGFCEFSHFFTLCEYDCATIQLTKV